MTLRNSKLCRTGFIMGLFCFVLQMSACNFKDEKSTSNEPDVVLAPDTAISFADIQSQILVPNCVGCHSQAGGNRGSVNLESYASVKLNIDEIQSSTVDTTRMPQGDTLNKNLIALLRTWIAQGAPETATK